MISKKNMCGIIKTIHIIDSISAFLLRFFSRTMVNAAIRFSW